MARDTVHNLWAGRFTLARQLEGATSADFMRHCPEMQDEAKQPAERCTLG